MRVHVKQLDINRGEVADGDTCPVARATRRALRKIGRYPQGVCAGNTALVITSGPNANDWRDNEESIMLPKKVSAFIEAFDETGTGTPFAFTMRRPA